MPEKIKIDPEQFARLVVSSTTCNNEENLTTEEKAKEKLTQYLSAYYLANNFNEFEKEQFEQADKQQQYPSYQEIVDTINATKWFY
jgi:hypothetical protein